MRFFTFFNRLVGRCLIFAEPKTEEVFATERRSGVEDENPADLIYESRIRIILDNTTSLKYVVGILGDDIPFTAMMENMFKKNVTATSWLKFERLGKCISYFKTHREAATRDVLSKKVFLKMLQNSQEKTSVESLFLQDTSG